MLDLHEKLPTLEPNRVCFFAMDSEDRVRARSGDWIAKAIVWLKSNYASSPPKRHIAVLRDQASH